MKRKIDIYGLALIAGSLLYLVSIIWINFNGNQWYSFDIYSDAFVAKLMAEQNTLFPDNWVFGNQYYVIATPVLAALIYTACHNSVLALAIASCIMTVAVLFCFYWCIRPFVKKRSTWVGVFCMSGAVILGNSASSYMNGLQYFYTMASFYACYVFVIFLTLGLFFRLLSSKRINSLAVALNLLFSIALGMQSLRGTLVLHLPLLAVSVLLLFFKKIGKMPLLFSVTLLIANVIGILVMKYIPTQSIAIISDVKLTLEPAELIGHLTNTFSEFLTITGLSFFQRGIKWLPLFCIATFFFGVVLWSIITIIREKDFSVISIAILFCLVSVLSVIAVGILMFQVRSIYFFVWYLLVVFSFVYLIEKINRQNLFTVAILLCGAASYFFNFYPDFSHFQSRNHFYQQISDELIEEKIDCVYYDWHTSPLFAVFSQDRIVSGTVNLDLEKESGQLMYPVAYLLPVEVFENAGEYNSYLVFSNWTFDYLEQYASEEYIDELMSHLTFVKKVAYEDEEFTFYKFSPELLSR